MRYTRQIKRDQLSNRAVLRLFSGTNGVDQLDPNLTINGATVTPMFRYKGGDADGTNWDPWTYGSILPLQAGAAPTYNQGSPGLGSNDDSVLLNGGGYYKDSGTSTGDVGTEDLVFEMVIKTTSGAANTWIMSKRDALVPSAGWSVYNSNSSTIVLFFDSGTPQAAINTNTLTANIWNHIMFFINRDEASTNGGNVYVNGVLSNSADLSTVSATLTNTNKFMIGADQDGLNIFVSNIAYLAGWKQSSWHQAGAAGPTEWAAIVKERFLKFSGFYSPKGTVTYARATETALDKLESGNRKIYIVGDHWLRLVHRADSAADEITGYLSETSDRNQLLYSEDFTNAAWVKTRCTIDSNNMTAPDKSSNADGIIATAVSDTHYVGQSIASTAAEHVLSVFAKAGDKNWLYLNISSVANANAYYDLSTATLGTVGAGATAHIEDWGDGWCRCIIVYTGGAPSHSHDIYAAEADNDHTFTGDGSTVNTWIWGAVHSDQGLGYPTSYIKTVGSIVTRVADSMQVDGLVIPPEGKVIFDVLFPDFDNGPTRVILQLSKDDNNRHVIETRSGDLFRAEALESGSPVYDLSTGGGDIVDGTIHNLKLRFGEGIQERILDGVLVSPIDTATGLPTGLTKLYLGHKYASKPNCIIADVKITR